MAEPGAVVALRSAKPIDVLEKVCADLARAVSVDEVKGVRDRAEALRAYAKQAGLGLEAQNRAAVVKLRAERRAGELLAEAPKKANQHDACDTLSQAGIERHAASRWQRIAALPGPTFESYVADTAAAGREVTTAGALKLAKQHRDSGAPDAGLPPLPKGTFRTLTADPPWRYGNTSTRGAAQDHYDTLSIEQLTGEEPLPDGTDLAAEVNSRTADEAHLYLWTTAGHLPDAFRVMHAWGFTYKTYLVWVKPQMGMGNYFRVSTELVLFGVKGGLRTGNRALMNYFEARRGRHSAKPRAFRELVKKASPGPYLELFGRCRRDQMLTGCECSRCQDGWEVWGNET